MSPNEPTDSGGGAAQFDSSADPLEIVIDTLQQLEPHTQDLFLQKFLKRLVGLEIAEREGRTHWEEILNRRNDLARQMGRSVGLLTAALDYFTTTSQLRTPILLEYGELTRLRQDAATDPLTGLYNRRLFDGHLARELNRSRRYYYPLSVLLFDLRNFKLANDTHGHTVGDEILRSFARTCTQIIRSSDFACRIGGDEFGLVLPHSDNDSAPAMAKRITKRFEEYARRLAPEVELGVDHGVATYPTNGTSPTELYGVADRNLYTLKTSKRAGAEEPPAKPRPSMGTVELVPQSIAPETAEAPPPPTAPLPRTRDERLYARLSLEGTDARGVLHNDFGRRVLQMLDFSLGGAAFLVDDVSFLPETFYAQLRIPIFPTARIKLRRVYTHRLTRGMWRLGCSFAP